MRATRQKTILGELNVYKADKFLLRLKGLLFAKQLSPSECILIEPCGSIHTVGMRYSIHVMFLSDDFTILRIKNNLKPNRFCLGSSKASKVVEFSAEFDEIPSTVIGKKFIRSRL
uniref:DUF192 domain-containing protein n=1 Tax=uncultured Psychrobacter sp. TaxID=259303 RepID=UPI002609F04F|nr:DUF192 domain-containing protein [uncultured Psychrobacter sp.]